MSDVSQPTVDEAGISRTPTGEIVEPKATETTKAPEKTEPEPKVEGDKSLLNQKTEAKEEPKAGAPEKYADFKAPDGFEIAPEVAAEAGALFKELNLTQEQAQKAIDLYAKHSSEAFQAPFKAYQDMRAEWKTAAKALPEIGAGLEPNGKVVVTIGKMLDQIGDAALAKDFRDAMDLTGAGDHPAFIRVMYHLAQQLTEGTSVKGNGPSKFGQQPPGQGRKSAASEMYPNLPSASGT